MNYSDWRAELEALAVRFSHLGITADLASLAEVEAYALLTLLRRLVGQ